MFKKLASLCLLVAVFTATLAGCGNNSDKPEVEATPNTNNVEGNTATTEIEFFQTKREAVDTWDVIIEEFNSSHDSYKIVQNNVSDSGTVLAARMATNDMPDIFNTYPQTAEFHSYMEDDWVQNITDWECLDNIKDDYKQAVTYDNGIYCMPFSLNFMGIYYNVDKFEESGYTEPTTWAELMEIADDITSNGEIAFNMPNKDAWTMNQLYANILTKDTGTYYTALKEDGTKWTDGPYLKIFEKIKQLVSYAEPDSLSVGYDQAISDFANGKGYMFIQGSWAYPSIISANPDANIKMFPMPNDNGDMKQQVWIDISLCAGINEHDGSALEGVREFFAYLSQTSTAQSFSDLDHSPSCIKDVVTELPYAESVIDLINSNSVLDTSYQVTGFDMGNYIQMIVDQEAESVAEKVQSGWDEALNQQ